MAEMPEPEALLEHRAFLRAIAKGLLRDEDAAEDVAQDALLAAMETPPKGRNVRGWLGAVARNLSLMARRGERRRREREMRAARPEAAAPATEALELLELQRKVVDAVRALDEPYRTAIVLHYFHDLPVRQLAARLRVPKETARTRLRRGLALLRARLDGEYRGNRSWLPLLVTLAADPRKVPVAGVALMSAKAKVAVAAVLCILLTLGAVKWGGSGGSEPPPRAETARLPAPREAEASLPPAPDLPDPVDFNTVDRDRDLHGIVVDRAGNPIAGAELQAVFYPHRRVFTYHPDYEVGYDGPRTESAADGTFRIPLEPGQEVWLRAVAAGFAPLELAHLQAGERTRVQLTEPAELVLRVKDEAGAPVSGAEVTVRSSQEIEIRRSARTDAQGVARWSDLPAGALVYLSATHPARGGGIQRYGVGVPADVEIVLPAGREHTGRVTDAATGAPIAQARVGMNFWTLEPDTRTDEQGRYRLNGWMGDPYAQEIYASADGYVMSGAALGAATVYDFALDRGIEVTGRLLGEGGKPVPGASIAALGGVLSLRGTTGTPLSRAHGTSDAKGEFRLAPLKASALHTLVVAAPGHGRYLLDFDTETGATALGDIVLPASFCIAGAILDSTGAPVPRCRLTLEGQKESRSRRRSDLFEGRTEDRWTDDLGRFRFDDLAPGSYRVWTNPRGGSSVSRRVVVKDADIQNVKLELPDDREFVVWVVDDAGAPVPDAGIRVEHDAGNSFGNTDQRGRAELRVSGSIKRIHSPSATGYGEAEPVSGLTADANEARFVLPRWEEIHGTVVDEAGAPVAEAIVEVRWGSAEPRKVSTSGHGKFHIGVPPGTIADLRVVGKYIPAPGLTGGLMEGGGLVGEMLGVAAGSRDVVIRASVPRRDATIRVRVVTPDGKPLAGARVTYQPQPLENRVTVETDADGRAVLTDLPAAEITVSAFFDGARSGFVFPLWRKVTPAGQEVELKCRAAAHLKGIVVDPEGKPVWAQVLAIHEGQMFNAFADKQGRFDLVVPADAESLDLQAVQRTPDGGQLQGYAKHRLADGEARIVVKPPD